MKKYLFVAFVISLLIVIFNKHRPEKVARTEGDILIFESGNRARIFEPDARFTGNNPLHLRSYIKYSFDNKQIEEGLYDYDGNFFPNADPTESTNFFFGSILLLSITAYLIGYARNDFILARDWYNARTDVAFTALPPQRRNTLLKGKMSCDRCNTEPDFAVDKELRVQGMIFVEGACKICGEQKKIRLK